MMRYGLALLCTVAGSSALGEILPLEQERTLSVTDSGCPFDPELSFATIQADDFEPWWESLSLPVSSCGVGEPTYPVHATAIQRSEINGAGLFASGTARCGVYLGGDYIEAEIFSGSDSRFRVQFVILQSTSCDVSGIVNLGATTSWDFAPAFLSGSLTVKLRQVGGSALYTDALAIDMVDTNAFASRLFASHAVLEPGVYEIDVTTSVDMYGWFAAPDVSYAIESAYMMSLDFLEGGQLLFGADLDHDGDIDLADYAIFQAAFSGSLVD